MRDKKLQGKKETPQRAYRHAGGGEERHPHPHAPGLQREPYPSGDPADPAQLETTPDAAGFDEIVEQALRRRQDLEVGLLEKPIAGWWGNLWVGDTDRRGKSRED